MDGELLKKIVFDLISCGRTSDEKTKEFQKLNHNADLIPMIKGQLELILDYFYKYREIVYDVQGIRDHGVDIVLKYEQDLETKKLGFQVKSYKDIEAIDWQKTLKAQAFETQAYHSNGMEDFYVLFCTDLDKHRDRLRNATADLAANDKFLTQVIQPNKILHFLNLSDAEIGAYIKRRLSQHDFVFAEATDSLATCSVIEGSIIIETLIELNFNGRNLTADDLVNSTMAHEVISLKAYSSDIYLEREILSVLNKGYFNLETHTGMLTVSDSNLCSVLAVAYDAKVRYQFTIEQLKWYLFYSLMADQIEEEEIEEEDFDEEEMYDD